MPDTTPADLDALAALVAEKRTSLANCDLGASSTPPAVTAGYALADAADELLAEVRRLRADLARLRSPSQVHITVPLPINTRISPQVVVGELYRAGWRPPGDTTR